MGSSLPFVRHTLHSPLERLVGLGFRCSMSCLRISGPVAGPHPCALLETCIKSRRLPASLNSQFNAWALAVEASAERSIELLDLESPGFSPDETLAIALVAACQHSHCPALTACASALLGTYDLGRALAATQILAHSLSSANAVLQPRGSAEDGAVAPGRSKPNLRIH